ncbi:MAG TPA: valine--tRNA ligase, partial [Spirochaetota bacterium]|nr:valine--tRNA ligase [Spirochaetota bacterium]
DKTETFKEIVYRIRNIRGEMNIPPDKKASVVLKTDSQLVAQLVESEKANFHSLAKLDHSDVDPSYSPDKTDAAAVMPDIEIYMPLKGLIDMEKEAARLSKEIDKINGELKKVKGKLSNEKFLSKAPADVVAKEKAKQEELQEIMEKIQTSLNNLS